MSSQKHRHKHRKSMSRLGMTRSTESKPKVVAFDATSVRKTKNKADAHATPATMTGEGELVEYDLMTGTAVTPMPVVAATPTSQRPRNSTPKDVTSQRPSNVSSKRHKKKYKSNSHRANNSRDTFQHNKHKNINDSIRRRFRRKKKPKSDRTDKTEVTKTDETKRAKRRDKDDRHESSSSSSDKEKAKNGCAAMSTKDVGSTKQKYPDANPAMVGIAAAVNGENQELVPVVGPITPGTPYNNPHHKKNERKKKKKKQQQEDDLENAPTIFESVDAPIRPTTDEMPIRKIETTKEFPKEGTGKAAVCIDETPTAYGQVEKKPDDDGRSSYLPVYPFYK